MVDVLALIVVQDTNCLVKNTTCADDVEIRS